MLDVSVTIGVENRLDWPRWKRLVEVIEAEGFAGLYLSDHFAWHDTDGEALEPMIALAYLADHTTRVRFGQLVSPFTIREPVMLLRQAIALNDLSGGRMILGVGAGNGGDEHLMFGYDFPDVPTRMDRLAEGLEVTTRLLHSDGPASFSGRFFRLENAVLPHRSGLRLPILVAGRGPRRTVPLAARYADIWNGQRLTPDEYRSRSALLDRHIAECGRRPEDVKRTMAIWVFCGRDKAELEQRAAGVRGADPSWADLPLDAMFDQLQKIVPIFVGTPEAVVERLRAYEVAGATEVMLHWWGIDDIAGLKLIAQEVLPHVTGALTS